MRSTLLFLNGGQHYRPLLPSNFLQNLLIHMLSLLIGVYIVSDLISLLKPLDLHLQTLYISVLG